MNEKLLDILCCPVTHQGLRKARSDELASVNRAIADGVLATEGGAARAPLRAALVTLDGARLYPIEDGAVALLGSDALDLSGLEA